MTCGIIETSPQISRSAPRGLSPSSSRPGCVFRRAFMPLPSGIRNFTTRPLDSRARTLSVSILCELDHVGSLGTARCDGDPLGIHGKTVLLENELSLVRGHAR